MKKIVYPLEDVLDIKKRRVNEARKIVREKQRILQIEEQKLVEQEIARDKIKSHRDQKFMQLFDIIEKGTSSDKILQMRAYLDVVKEKLVIEENKVKKQQEQVNVAEQQLKIAKNDLKEKNKELEKIEIHKEEWGKEMLKELEHKESMEQEDIGSTMFLTNLFKKNHQIKE